MVHRLNRAWQSGRIDDLAPLFHEQAVIVDSTHELLAEGRSACVESYRTFVASATVEVYEEGEAGVRMVGPVAFVTVPFEMAYRTGGGSYREAGSDALALVWEDDRWQVVWRQLVWSTA